jgi:hypothetical protein
VYTPTRRSKALLPFPLELSLQTLKFGDERGWGARLGVDLGKPLGERLSVGVRGEVAYDDTIKVAYDVAGHLDLRLTPGLAAIGYVGYDRMGTGEETAIEGALYYGGGGSWGKYFDDGGLDLEIAYLLRSVPSDSVMDLGYPDHEWRFKGRMFWPSDGRITGISTEYRTAGDAKTFLLGLRVRL